MLLLVAYLHHRQQATFHFNNYFLFYLALYLRSRRQRSICDSSFLDTSYFHYLYRHLTLWFFYASNALVYRLMIYIASFFDTVSK
jgi:hypothetical protein